MELESARLLAAGLCMGLGALGPALGEGLIGSKAMEAMGRNPEVSNTVFTNMIIAMAVTETTGIYSLVISFLILFAV